MTRKQICPEYLGDIDTEALLQNLKNFNPYYNTIDGIRNSLRGGFQVSAEYEVEWDDSMDTPTNRKRLVRIVLEPQN